MIPKKIGYIICESGITSAEVTNVVGTKNGKIVAEGILQTADERNRNGRFYPKEELFPQLTAPRTLELLNAGYLRAELGHPLSKELVRQQTIDDSRTCAKFLKLWTEGDNVWGRFTGTNNDYGKAFMADLADGDKPAWSLRALGSIENTRRGAEVRNLKVITWDQVIYPSHPGAYTQRIVSESVGDKDYDIEGKSLVIPLTNQEVLNYIRSESANLKYMRESFDFMYKDIQINENNSTVTLTGADGDIMVINLENYIHNEIMNYCSDVSSYFEK
jgi:hypothetical protein